MSDSDNMISSEDSVSRAERRQIEAQLRSRAKDQGAGIKGHLITFALTTAALAVINFTIAGPFPWVFFPAAGWGIGIVAHIQSWLNRKQKKRRFLAAKSRTKEQQYLIRKLHHMEGRFKQHRDAYFTCGGFLAGTNMITSPGFLWSLIPMGLWAVGLFSHWASYRSGKKIIVDELASQGIDWKRFGREISNAQLKSESAVFIDDNGIMEKMNDVVPAKKRKKGSRSFAEDMNRFYAEADAIKAGLMAEFKENDALKAHWGGELEQILDKFILQIKELIQVYGELDRAAGSTNSEVLKREMAVLEEKKDKSTNRMLVAEYVKSIDQYKHQIHSLEDLKDRQEIVQLRLNSSLMLIRQLKLDAARIKNINNVEEPFSLKEIRSKSEELTRYLEDIHDSYRELEED